MKGLAQAIVAATFVFAACLPYKAALAEEQTGIGAIDVTVRQVVSRDSDNDEPAKDEPEDKGSDNSEVDSSKKNVTPQALEDAREVAGGNEWFVVAPLPDNKTDDAVAESNTNQETSAISLTKTGDSNLFGIAVATSCSGIGIGAIALMLRAHGNRDEARRTDNESS